ncbi:MAG: hypothetical protein QOG04_1611 [Actinomycetota bacterium]|jgi:hypothetical protein|nr:hypothetical protein [Actinomycetota bacterium]
MRIKVSRRSLGLALSAAVIASSFVVQSAPAQAQVVNQEPGQIKAGFGKADATWHVGAGAGQYTNKDGDDVVNAVGDGDVDPHGHSVLQHDSYGVQSRLSYRAIVVQDAEGDQVAFVKSDSYLAQDYLSRRAAQILQLAGSSITFDEIYHMASHNHSSPYYMTPSWGVWIFQDAFDIRAFEYHARQMAQAILNAENNLVPARMGATVIEHDLFKGMVAHKGLADDGTPKGYPDDFGDLGLSVVRFDDMSDPSDPQPLGTMVNWGQHPEGLDNYDLITGDYVSALERFVERGTGAPMMSGQGDVGSAEQGPGRPDKVAALGIPTEWSHAGHAQTERGGYLLAQDVIKAWNAIGEGHPADEKHAANFVPFSSNFDVEAGNAWVPGPYSHPYPSVSNCRTKPTVDGDVGGPVTGFPDCDRGDTVPYPDHPFGGPFSQLWDTLKAQGVPLPEQYDAPAFTGVEENLRIHLQAFKIGEVVMLSCSCEAQVDLILNVESRTNETQNDIWDGYDWTDRMDCTQASAGGDWTCVPKSDEPRPQAVLGPHTFTDAEYRRMKAEIHNPANGWDAISNAAFADGEPNDPSKIWGNFTHVELPEQYGYKLPIGTGHTGDYNGYTVSYREYMSYDHYRKALTSYGPHTADYMNTRLTKLAGSLNGQPQPLDPQEVADTARAAVDEARQVAMSTALGAASFAAYEAWTRALPNDKGPAAANTQPQDISRFDAATFSWIGGDNAVDNPTVKVQRFVDGKWVPFADQSGEVQTKVRLPKGVNAFTDTYSGNQEWLWTANFEAFDALPAGIGSTPEGRYRFVVDGLIRKGTPSANAPYHLVSHAFQVSAWDGLKVQDLQATSDSVSFSVDSTYPGTYTGPAAFPYIQTSGETPQGDDVIKRDENGKLFCLTCAFRPWADHGEVQSATVTIERADGAIEKVAATLGDDGRWYAPVVLNAGDHVSVAPGDVIDNYGETNGSGSDALEFTATETPAEDPGLAIPAV